MKEEILQLIPQKNKGSSETNKYYLTIKRRYSCHLQQHEWILKAFCYVKVRQRLYDLIYMWNLNKKKEISESPNSFISSVQSLSHVRLFATP